MQSISSNLEKYDLELDRVVQEIKKQKAKIVAIQLPDGLKPYALEITKVIEEKTDATPILWAGSCWGACDVPDLDKIQVDLLIQWGHSEWTY